MLIRNIWYFIAASCASLNPLCGCGPFSLLSVTLQSSWNNFNLEINPTYLARLQQKVNWVSFRIPLQELFFFFLFSPHWSQCFKLPLKTTEEDRAGMEEATEAYLLLNRFAIAAVLSWLKVIFILKEEQRTAVQAGRDVFTLLQSGFVKSSTLWCSRNGKPGAQAPRFCCQ